MDARLDATTRAKVDELAQRFHQPRAGVVCHIMQWGLSRGPTETFDGGASEGPVRHLYFHVDTKLHTCVEEAASAAGMKIAPWLRAMVRQMTIDDFPANWEVERLEERSHDSRIYSTRFMLRLDAASETTLQQLISHFGVSKAAIIRQLRMQANPEDFPTSWHVRVAERCTQHAQRHSTGSAQEPSLMMCSCVVTDTVRVSVRATTRGMRVGFTLRSDSAPAYRLPHPGEIQEEDMVGQASA